MFDYLVMLEQV